MREPLFTCDRCGRHMDAMNVLEVTLYAARENKTDFELCAKCAKEFREWARKERDAA